MAYTLILGIILAILGGIANSSGSLLQKFAINNIPKSEREDGYFKKLIKSPSWIIGLILILVASGGLIVLAQIYIGAALIPGLMSIGMIVLAIGAVKLLKEKLKISEFTGIAIMIIGITIIGLSALEITNTDMENLADVDLVIRLAIYSSVFFILWIIFRQLGKRLEKGNTIYLALGAAFPFALANAWMQPFIYLFRELINGNYTTLSIILFIISIPIISVVNILGIGHIQDAYKYGDVAIVAPIVGIPQQIAPIILYYGVYMKSSPLNYSIYLFSIGIVLIIIAGFLLGRRQGLLEIMDKDQIKDENKDNEVYQDKI